MLNLACISGVVVLGLVAVMNILIDEYFPPFNENENLSDQEDLHFVSVHGHML